MSIRWMLVSAALLVASVGVSQVSSSSVACDGDWGGWRFRGARVCEIREFTVPVSGALSVDAGPNGGIQVAGERRRGVQVTARVQAWARDESEAQRIVSAVTIRSDGVIKAEGPEQQGRTGWSVSYELLTPRDIDLTLETHNGGITVADVHGALAITAVNGGIHLEGVAGNVRGRTTNGGVDATLVGDAWEGEGLDLKTTNGGVRLRLPEGYSARLESKTVNGGIDIEFPVTLQGRIGREISTTLGKGGAPIRASTTNGGVRISLL